MKSSPSPLLSGLAVLLLSALASPLSAAETVAEFDGGVGSQPFAAGAAGPIPNDVRGVNPGGRPWEIRKLKATVRNERGQTRIVVKGEGLILGGGGNIGLPGVPREVAATLFCGTEAFNSASVLTNASGDFEIKSPLLHAQGTAVPVPCTTPILLIRNAPAGAPGAWFAAGIPRLPDDNGHN